MELRRRQISKGMVLPILLVCVASLSSGFLNLQSEFHLVSKQEPQPPSSATTPLFPCIQSWALTNHKIRVAVLHGPDWFLESSVRPSCFPEREVVFAAKVGRGIISRPFTARTRLWVTKDRDVIYIKILASSGSIERDMVAVSLATNRRCIDKSSKNCIINGAVLPRID